ncbi:MAG: hypothetical protein CO066_14715 [Comamonadaceae bacterium CG_4_9_14_0_8_um_filter_60_18]|nr:MAG: hypothetical protein CO066_14715 [Comamonadaceae bacterium CG_4_9_14_0_8_um_filter_60_18]
MKIDRLLRCSICVNVASCSQKEHAFNKGSSIMEQRYIEIDIDAHIRNAQQLRSEALGEILRTIWKNSVAWLAGFVNRRLEAHIVAARSSATAMY